MITLVKSKVVSYIGMNTSFGHGIKLRPNTGLLKNMNLRSFSVGSFRNEHGIKLGQSTGNRTLVKHELEIFYVGSFPQDPVVVLHHAGILYLSLRYAFKSS